MTSKALPRRVSAPGGVLLAAFAMAGCAQTPGHGGLSAQNSREIGAFTNKKYGPASPRVASGTDIPSGGGNYLVGRPYHIAGRTYYPREQFAGYSATGTSSWYGDAFHGRRTANGEIYNKYSLSAAHPTMPLPSYARVTNLRNNYSVIVRVNDRGPYHGGRVLDVSERVADTLDFKGQGTARIKVDYVGRASLDGADDRTLLATLRTDGALAQLDGYSAPAAVQTAQRTERVGTNLLADAPVAKARKPVTVAPLAPEPEPAPAPLATAGSAAPVDTVALFSERPRAVARNTPLPPSRPFALAAQPLGAGLPVAAYAAKPAVATAAMAVATAHANVPLPPAAPRKHVSPAGGEDRSDAAPLDDMSALYFAPAPIAARLASDNPFGALRR